MILRKKQHTRPGGEGIAAGRADYDTGRRCVRIGGTAVAGPQSCVHVFVGWAVFLAHWSD